MYKFLFLYRHSAEWFLVFRIRSQINKTISLLAKATLRSIYIQSKIVYVMSQKTEKTRYSDEELNEFRQLIEDKLEKAQEQLGFYKQQIADLADNPDAKIKGLDDGIGTAESERLYNMAARQRKHIQHLENALVRIQNKVYGVCRETGKLISKERLRAVPHATLSIEAKQNRSSRK